MDDDVSFATLASRVVGDAGGGVTAAHLLADARKIVDSTVFDLILLDNHLPEGKGYDFFNAVSRRNPDAVIIMITGMPDLSEAVTLTRNGLFEYITKPVPAAALAASIERAKLRLRSRLLPEKSTNWFGDAPAMREIMAQLAQAARHGGSTVLLTGETGTGKDVAARMLHQLGKPKAGEAFIALNCAALPGEMFESELFGAERGAFTGADKKRIGLAAAAAGGTLFLDEIAEVPLLQQAKLLRLLEAREFRPLGATDSVPFTGRFVAATNKNLAEEVKAGRFREDLLYRLDVFSVELPPLRKRRSDIPGLAELLLTQLAERYQRSKPLLTSEDMTTLSAHDFPGNIRELRNVLERSLLKTPEDSNWLSLDVNWLTRNKPIESAPAVKQVAPVPGNSSDPLPPDRVLSPVDEQEYRLIRNIMRESNGGIRRAAGKLGMSPQALLRRLEKWPELRV